MIAVNITIDEEKLKELVIAHLNELLGTMNFNKDDVKIEVKSKQNYKAEWEVANFRATINKTT